jgi:predicted dehydrogenase
MTFLLALLEEEIMDDPVNLAVIGAGYWGTKLAREYLEMSRKRQDVVLSAIADTDDSRLLTISNTLNLPTSMLRRNYAEVIDDSKVTAVHISTPNETHYDIAMKAIEAGKHVLLEKPMCLTVGDALKLARFSEKSKLTLLIGHVFRFNNAINMVKKMVENEADKPRYVELEWMTMTAPPPGRDIIFDLAPHPIDILNHVFEEWPTEVYAKAKSYERKKTGLEEVAFIMLEFPNDMLASIMLSWLHHGPRQRTVTIVNRKNTIKVAAVEQTISLYQADQRTEIPVKSNNTIESEVTHFIECIKRNEAPINSALTGVMNVTVLEAINRSLKENSVIPIVGR